MCSSDRIFLAGKKYGARLEYVIYIENSFHLERIHNNQDVYCIWYDQTYVNWHEVKANYSDAVPVNISELLHAQKRWDCWIVLKIYKWDLWLLDAKVQGAHYDKSSTDYEKITITIPDKLLNYRFDSNDARSSEYAQSGELVLHPSSSDTFTSNGMPINIRLIVPDTIYVDYCEYALNENCFQIDNILQPAPYFYVGQLEIYDQMSTLNESLELLIILVIILIIIVPVIVLGSKYVKNNSDSKTSRD